MGTLASAKMRAASVRLIQSEATRGMLGPSPSRRRRRLESAPAAGAAGRPRRGLRCPVPELARARRCPSERGLRRAIEAGRAPSPESASVHRPAGALLPPPAAAGFAAARASFLAQPLPLKWMAGVERALRMGPPQAAQVAGPAGVDAVADLHLPAAVGAAIVVGGHGAQPRRRRMPHLGQKYALRPTWAKWQCGQTRPFPESGGSGRSSSTQLGRAPRARRWPRGCRSGSASRCARCHRARRDRPSPRCRAPSGHP